MKKYLFFCFWVVAIPSALLAENIEEPFKVGITLPLTGALSEFGVAVGQGVLLAQEEHADLLKNVQFKFEDDGYEPKRAITAAQRFFEIDDISLLHTWGTETTLAVVPIAEAKGYPIFAGTIDPRGSVKRNWAIGMFSTYDAYSSKLIKELSDKNTKSVVIIKSELTFFNGLIDGLEKARPSEMQMRVEASYAPSDQDFRTTIAKLKTQKFDRLGLYLTNPQLVAFLRQASEQKLAASYFGPSMFYDRRLVAEFGAQLKGALFTHNSCEPEFHKRYFDRFKTDTHIAYAANAYQFARLVGDLFGDGVKRSNHDILDRVVHKTLIRRGVAGEFSLATHPEGGRYLAFPAAVYEISENGEFRLVR